MRIVIQRVVRAAVRVEGRTIGQIGKGLLLLVGVGKEDKRESIHALADKVVQLRIFSDEEHRMNRSLGEAGGEILCVSQFTLYGDCRKGRRPSYDRAARSEDARAMFESFVGFLRDSGATVHTGQFQAMMEVESVNDGPVTLLLDSEKTI